MPLEIPSDLIEQFTEVSKENFSVNDGGHIETLAFVAGFTENNERIATHLIFPDQSGSASIVNDLGKL